MNDAMNNTSAISRARTFIGLIAGVFFLVSSAAHSLLGWKELSGELAKVNASPDLTQSLAIGWHFGGAAMLVFGVIVCWTFAQAWRKRAVSLTPLLFIALGYATFGAVALAATRNAFFLMFVIHGLLLSFAAWPPSKP
jgi:hypothetical protein